EPGWRDRRLAVGQDQDDGPGGGHRGAHRRPPAARHHDRAGRRRGGRHGLVGHRLLHRVARRAAGARVTDALIAIAVGYLLGSLPFGYWAGRLRGIDLRLVGSGNTGATNVMRVLGLKIGVPVMALDIGKGAVAVLIARGATDNELVWVLAAAAAVTGHMYPLFLGFQGRQGVASGAGVMLALVPWMGVAAFLVWLCISLATRYVS